MKDLKAVSVLKLGEIAGNKRILITNNKLQEVFPAGEPVLPRSSFAPSRLKDSIGIRNLQTEK